MEQRSKLDKAKDQNMTEIKKVDSRVEKMTSEITSTERNLKKLIDENPWVRAEKDMFGDPNSTEYKGIS